MTYLIMSMRCNIHLKANVLSIYSVILVCINTVPRGKDISSHLIKASVAPQQSGRVIRPLPNKLESIMREIIHKQKTFKAWDTYHLETCMATHHG